LSNILGDKTTFTLTSPTADPLKNSRTFTGFNQAAIENADSRVMAGLHFRFSCNAGLDLGKNVGTWILEHHLLPVTK
jgi:hypothetical protein